MMRHLEIFQCPRCEGNLELRAATAEVICKKCAKMYAVNQGIPLLFYQERENGAGNDITEVIKSFYEETPFPHYEELETVADLIQKAECGLFARMLNEQVPFRARVLDAGCGTGQLSNYLGIAERFLFGVDMRVNSLKLANAFKQKNEIERTGFYQMNLFRPIFKKESFDFVISNGVLHHTNDPYGAFKSLCGLVKKNGHILIGLYNTYGRFITNVRRGVFNMFNDRFTFLDPHLRENIGVQKKVAWFRDQYKNPYESKHTIGEVLRWFDAEGFDFIYGIPNPKAFEGFSPKDSMFSPHERGNALDHFLVQLKLLCKGSREGGFFIMIGKKREGGYLQT